jgi:hypothetical protein
MHDRLKRLSLGIENLYVNRRLRHVLTPQAECTVLTFEEPLGWVDDEKHPDRIDLTVTQTAMEPGYHIFSAKVWHA